MKTDGLTVLVNRTYNLGNYESVKIEVGVTISLDNNDHLDDAKDKAFEWINSRIKGEYVRSYQQTK